MARTINLGMPRIGPRRELKQAVEGYWSGAVDEPGLAEVARTLRQDGWQVQSDVGIDSIPSNDFSLYDQMLDAACLVGAIPSRFQRGPDGAAGLKTYFSMARGRTPLDMTKWFDTNYHYLVPELGPDSSFDVASDKPSAELGEAADLGVPTRPVLIGPVTFLLLARSTGGAFDTLDLLDRLLPVYAEVIRNLDAKGAAWVQLDEPCLVTDLSDRARAAYRHAYEALSDASASRLLLATYFGGLGDNLDLAVGLPVDGLHVDLVRDPAQLGELTEAIREDAVLSAGVVDGRNVWRTDIDAAASQLRGAEARLGDRLWVGPSCSLLHVPHDLTLETRLDPALVGRLAFARQKLDEIAAIADRLTSLPARESRSAAMRERLSATPALSTEPPPSRPPRSTRVVMQREVLGLPELPTTTIGSFPQTADIRRARSRLASGELDEAGYRRFCEAEIERVIREQEQLGLDVRVHGEPERNDMVQYFGERLAGFATTDAGWVQSYGTRCVRPPVLYGRVRRPEPMTVAWYRYAQSLTRSPVKGMLTGPVTILQWSFVRVDQPRADTCREIAVAIRDEVLDLELAGARIIQVDEPALREGLPLRRDDRTAYLDWATACFRLATSALDAATQIHTHMCYAEVGEIAEAVAALDVDVVSVEAARSAMAVVDDLAAAPLAAEIGPGVYDIHSPHVPTVDEVAAMLRKATAALGPDRVWVNPDCGLKTRNWDEVRPALANMVAAARAARRRVASGSDQ